MAFHVRHDTEGSVASEATENSNSHVASLAYEDYCSDNESEDWILDEIHRQIDDQLQADIEQQLEEQLWKEMDEQLEKQLDEQIQKELNQQLNGLLSTTNDHLDNDFSKTKEKDAFRTSASVKTSTAESVNLQQGASVCSINAQIQKIVHQYEDLSLDSMK